MTLYITSDGKVFRAETAEQLVGMLRADSFEETASEENFMHRVAKRVMDEYGLSIPTESAEAFVRGMLEAGLMTTGNKKEAVEI